MDQEKAKLTSELTFNEISGKMFRFANDEGPIGIIKFEENGTIGNHLHENEKFWEFDGHCLTVMNHDKSKRCKYVQSWRDYYGKWQMQALWNKENGHRHYLAEV